MASLAIDSLNVCLTLLQAVVAQDNGHQYNGHQDDQAHIHYGNNTGASQDRRWLLDRRVHGTFPAGNSASGHRTSLLR